MVSMLFKAFSKHLVWKTLVHRTYENYILSEKWGWQSRLKNHDSSFGIKHSTARPQNSRHGNQPFESCFCFVFLTALSRSTHFALYFFWLVLDFISALFFFSPRQDSVFQQYCLWCWKLIYHSSVARQCSHVFYFFSKYIITNAQLLEERWAACVCERVGCENGKARPCVSMDMVCLREPFLSGLRTSKLPVVKGDCKMHVEQMRNGEVPRTCTKMVNELVVKQVLLACCHMAYFRWTRRWWGRWFREVAEEDSEFVYMLIGETRSLFRCITA